jgi:hypothetical protein
MILADLQRMFGLPEVASAAYFAVRGDLHVTAWVDELEGRPGWWWVVARGPVPTQSTIVALGWSGGLHHRDRDIAVALSFARRERAQAAEVRA